MKIIFWGNGNRGVACLKELCAMGAQIDLVVTHPPKQKKTWYASVADVAQEQGLEVFSPEDPNEPMFVDRLRLRKGDLFILAGYGKIIKRPLIELPRLMCLDLHGGKLPEYRGSSPLNWSLINGEKSFGLSIINVDAGVDTGDVVLGRQFPIGPNDTIVDLHRIANEEFPKMLGEVVVRIEQGTYTTTKQDPSRAVYYPLRFPDDGLIFFDQFTAEQIHNRIRALTEPYPCAYTFFKKRKVKLVTSELHDQNYFGESGRVYRKTNRGLLVCASDRCLWITNAVFEDTGERVIEVAKRYEVFATLRRAAEEWYASDTLRGGSEQAADGNN